jgi:hypothetical protein
MADQIFKAAQVIGVVGAACLSGQQPLTHKRRKLVADHRCQDIYSVSAKLESRHWLLHLLTFNVGNSKKCTILANQLRL